MKTKRIFEMQQEIIKALGLDKDDMRIASVTLALRPNEWPLVIVEHELYEEELDRLSYLVKQYRLVDAAEMAPPPAVVEAMDARFDNRPPNCQMRMREEGKAYPRTCQVCGLGPCKYSHGR